LIRGGGVVDTAGMRTAVLMALVLAACGGEKTTSETESGGTGVVTTGGTDSASSGATSEATAAVTEASSGTGGESGVPAKYSDGCAPTDGAAVDFSIGISERSCIAASSPKSAMQLHGRLR